MVDQSLLEILVCPETKQPLRLADAGLIERLNESVRQGSLVTRGGQTVTDPLTEGLVREDGAVLYPVRDDIPIMLIDEAIPLSGHTSEQR
ncbi:MAG TPA: Trm112 family protein [Longimicrobiales bacterium]|nr:Trm112 family protein [Longimicrobiales bacterium]